MSVRNNPRALVAGTAGAAILVAHLILAVSFGLAASPWVGGAVVGLALVASGALHLVLAARRRKPTPATESTR